MEILTRTIGRAAAAVAVLFLLSSCTEKPLDPGAHNPVADSDIPPTPANVQVSVGANSVTIEWSVVAGADVAEYRVYRAEGSGTFSWLASTSALTYVDAQVVTGVTYRYQISAIKAGLEGSRSLAVTAVPVGADPVISGTALSPTLGDQATSFQWDCTYQHESNSAPVQITTVVDGIFILPMTQVSGGSDWVIGEDFRVNANLATGPHTHYYEAVAADGSRTRNPADVTISIYGPLVTN